MKSWRFPSRDTVFSLLGGRKALILLFLAVVVIKCVISIFAYFQHTPEAEAPSCQAAKAEIDHWLKDNNHCEQDRDCISAPLNCPFSCGIFINAAVDTAKIKAQASSYNEQCGFCVDDCIAPPPVCLNHQCVTSKSGG